MSTNTLLESASISIDAKSKSRSLITLEPLQKGFGHTLGNALRRVLVSSLTGCAVVEAKIEGALHEYTTLEGVEEDVLTILLNLRESAFSLIGNRDEVSLELKATQKGPVTLGAIQLPHDVEIVNPEHVIAHLTQDRELNIELKIERGQGERMAQRQELQGEAEVAAETVAEDINTLYLNAIFNPIKRVSYSVERARVGERTDLDKLIIDLETNGTRTPESAIREAAAIFLQQGLQVILDLKSPEEVVEEPEAPEVDPVLATPIDALEFGPRAAKCLKAEGIYFVGDLITQRREDLLMTPNLGKRSLAEIEKKLEDMSKEFDTPLELGTSLPDWPPAGLSYSDESEEAEEETRRVNDQKRFIMRHLKSGRKFSRESSHRRLMLRNMTCSLLKAGLIKTTLPKAKELRRVAEPMITLAKEDKLAHRRLAFDRLRDRSIVTKLFNELGPQYQTRPGGYLRIVKCGFRAGDNAPMAFIELV